MTLVHWGHRTVHSYGLKPRASQEASAFSLADTSHLDPGRVADICPDKSDKPELSSGLSLVKGSRARLNSASVVQNLTTHQGRGTKVQDLLSIVLQAGTKDKDKTEIF
jgi:hypothetical protein